MNNANWQWGAAINLTSFKERTIYPISATATATRHVARGCCECVFSVVCSPVLFKNSLSAAMKVAAHSFSFMMVLSHISECCFTTVHYEICYGGRAGEIKCIEMTS